jgi:hypothetical protein
MFNLNQGRFMSIGTNFTSNDNSFYFNDEEGGFDSETIVAEEEDLIVKNGEHKLIYPRQYKYKNILIESGGELVVHERSRKWLCLLATGDFTLSGSIVYRHFFDETGMINFTASDGVMLSHKFDAPEGGNGGAGGNHQSATGGAGAAGTRLDGGGGGGGAWWEVGLGFQNGTAAVGWSGSQSGYDGGDGGRQQRFLHGGLVYMSVAGSFRGKGGLVDVSGRDGVSGNGGQNGWSATGSFGAAGGGGGGGSPGGNGGVVKIKAKKIVGDDPTFRMDGGKAGNGGRGGDYNGRPGNDGTAGVAGFVDYL